MGQKTMSDPHFFKNTILRLNISLNIEITIIFHLKKGHSSFPINIFVFMLFFRNPIITCSNALGLNAWLHSLSVKQLEAVIISLILKAINYEIGHLILRGIRYCLPYCPLNLYTTNCLKYQPVLLCTTTPR